MIEKLPFTEIHTGGEDMVDRIEIRPVAPYEMQHKINELVDAVNAIQKEREAERFEIQEWIGILEAVRKSVNIHEKQIDELQMKVEPEKCETPAENVQKDTESRSENVQDDHYWFKQQERYRAALVLIRDLTGGGMSYHDIVIEMREIAKWALDPNHQPLLIGRYNKEASELLDILRETKGGKDAYV